MPVSTENTSSNPESLAPHGSRHGLALCLSGGGYRAALFHLGAVRRLNELGVVSSLDTISSVSGGSIFAAHLARSLIDHGNQCFIDFERLVAAPFRQFVGNDIRTTPALARLLPWEWAHGAAGAEALKAQYQKLLVGDLPLSQLPDRPFFIFCATDLAYGVNWIFSKRQVGDYETGYLESVQAGKILVAEAVAASSCFPPVFRPLPMQLDPSALSGGKAPMGTDRDACIRALALSDGGVYDNMGLEPVWKTHGEIIVCDGGKPFTFAAESDTPHQLYRIHDVMANQAEAVRKRWLIASYLKGTYKGTYFGIHNSVDDFPQRKVPGYSKGLASQVISKIRTDMDRFSDAEIAVLENHGYALADTAYRSHVADEQDRLPDVVPLGNPWWPGAATTPSLLEQQIARTLIDSSRVKPLGH